MEDKYEFLVGHQGELLLLISFGQPLYSPQTSTHVGSSHQWVADYSVHSLVVVELSSWRSANCVTLQGYREQRIKSLIGGPRVTGNWSKE